MFFSMLSEAWHAMSANRLRTFLTMLGMVIGVGAVILMMAIGEGAQQSIKRSIDSMGSNLFVILSGSSSTSGSRSGSGNSSALNINDANAVGDLEDIAAIAPISTGNAQIIFSGNNWNTSIIGTSPTYFSIRGWNVDSGELFSDADIRSANRVALIGKTVAENLFGDDIDPIGKTIRIKKSPFTILGVLESKGQSFDGRDQDDTIIVPITTAQRKLFGNQIPGSVRMIMAQAKSEKYMGVAEDAINDLIRQRHNIRENAESDFSVRNLTAMAKTASDTAKTMSMLLGAIASISLLVGGIGIMNIMLVSVTERTREIGIRMAIGAREKDILLQFLLEACVISIVGCVIGVALGLGGALLVKKMVGAEILISMQSIILAFSVAASVGVFFGYYPASKAAKLHPIEALRYQ
ncbi:FtsX-like permease family protein [Candidatus Methylopumilus universalis]|jgi:putative ABC transport system permease protein|uniref:FtsX-like permease family protein n=1 Tax=Candidatus Methylopumilus universalis TaxID=2588536 RepID=A0AAX1F0U9_9PROT|nr:ABC transporter permease [Candidatus Methylopumilus universalis]QDC41657.1 FtsX-like permease family protein [Candidatus Methylopumilus universalis]QDC42938.1 FtsX-like permease family protein [Candidatus Methylopumilus universalis]QDC55327.1 FtsX-like permease family protein [Candidatus Methylopumilus universalis]QDC56606.1 FtsX-like permease family protein [Candidatus Methylopumilus universalis]QDC57897.1 FtsX-like permease family protein [Candidatus Methylopumilus universalis]